VKNEVLSVYIINAVPYRLSFVKQAVQA